MLCALNLLVILPMFVPFVPFVQSLKFSFRLSNRHHSGNHLNSHRLAISRLLSSSSFNEPFDYGSGTPKLFHVHHTDHSTVSSSDQARAMDIMRPYISEGRMNKMETVLRERCLDVLFLYENPVNPSNVYACLRTMDAFGVQVRWGGDPHYAPSFPHTLLH